MIKPQWFVKMDEMAKAAIEVLNKDLKMCIRDSQSSGQKSKAFALR